MFILGPGAQGPQTKPINQSIETFNQNVQSTLTNQIFMFEKDNHSHCRLSKGKQLLMEFNLFPYFFTDFTKLEIRVAMRPKFLASAEGWWPLASCQGPFKGLIPS